MGAVHESLAAFYRDLAEAYRARGLRLCALSADTYATAHTLAVHTHHAQYHALRHLRTAIHGAPESKPAAIESRTDLGHAAAMGVLVPIRRD
jgi:hypothetical protein